MVKERIDLTQFDWMEHHTIKHMEYTGDLAIVDVNAVQMIPELIDELKRMYERETELLTALQVIKEYTNESQSMDNIKEYVNNACDTNLPYWGCACQGPHTGPC